MPTMTAAEYQARAGNPLVARFLDLWQGPPLAPEYRFYPQRKWRFDLAHPQSMVAVELHGGTWNGGRHTRGRGFAKDREKMNAAQFRGWAVIELTTDQITPANVARVQQLVRERMQCRRYTT